MKLYFLTGLPTETDEDTLGIAELARNCVEIGRKHHQERRRSRCRSAGSCPSRSRRSSGSGRTPSPSCSARSTCCATTLRRDRRACSSSGTTRRPRIVEGLVSRGDRRLGPVIEDVWRHGGTFQEWSEHFDLDLWVDAMAAPRPRRSTGTCYRHRTEDEVLPVGPPLGRPAQGLPLAGLARRARPRSASRTAAGRRATTAAPAPATASSTSSPRPRPPAGGSQGTGQDLAARRRRSRCALPARAGAVAGAVGVVRVRLRFTKLGKVRFTSHRDVARLWERALRRAELPVALHRGLLAPPKVHFGLALSTGHESLGEYLDIDFREPEAPALDLAALPGSLTAAAARSASPCEAAAVIDRQRDLAAAGRDQLQLGASTPSASIRRAAPRPSPQLLAASRARRHPGAQGQRRHRRHPPLHPALAVIGAVRRAVAGRTASSPRGHLLTPSWPPNPGGSARPSCWPPSSPGSTEGPRTPDPPMDHARRRPARSRSRSRRRDVGAARRGACVMRREPHHDRPGRQRPRGRPTTPARPPDAGTVDRRAPDRRTAPTTPSPRRRPRAADAGRGAAELDGRRPRSAAEATAADGADRPAPAAMTGGGRDRPDADGASGAADPGDAAARPGALAVGDGTDRNPEELPDRIVRGQAQVGRGGREGPRAPAPDRRLAARRRRRREADGRRAARRPIERRRRRPRRRRSRRRRRRPAARAGGGRGDRRRTAGERQAAAAAAARRGRRPVGARAAPKPVEAILGDEPARARRRRARQAPGPRAQGPPGRSLPHDASRVRPTATQIAVLEGRNLIEHYVSRPADDVVPDPRQHLPRPGPERAARHGGRLRRHRHARRTRCSTAATCSTTPRTSRRRATTSASSRC